MASVSDHIALANRNHDALCYLLKEPQAHPEWVATVAFYKAVQVIEAVFAATSGKHSHGHDDRIGNLKTPKFSDLFLSYRPLYAASLVARYLEDSGSKKVYDHVEHSKQYHKFTDYMTADAVIKRLLKKRLKPLEEHAIAILGTDHKDSLHRIEVAL